MPDPATKFDTDLGVLDTSTVRLAGEVHIDSFATALHGVTHPTGRTLHIDLRDSEWLQLPTVLGLVAYVAQLGKLEAPLQINLPTSHGRKAFLWSIGFFDALKAAVREDDIRPLFGSEDQGFLDGLDTGPPPYVRTRLSDDGIEEPLSPVNFFEIKNYAAPNYVIDRDLAVRLAQPWDSAHIRTVLQKFLDRHADAVGRSVVFELAKNAVYHPSANLIQSTAQHDARRGHQESLWIAIWDNGISIVDSLRTALREHGTIVAPATREERAKYSVRGSTPRAKRTVDLSTASTVSPDTDDLDILLCALLPGVTRDVYELSAGHDSAGHDSVGHGLHDLVSNTVGLFGGSVYVLTKGHVLTVSGRPPNSLFPSFSGEYEASVRSTPSPYGSIAGNLIAARLPVGRHIETRL